MSGLPDSERSTGVQRASLPASMPAPALPDDPPAPALPPAPAPPFDPPLPPLPALPPTPAVPPPLPPPPVPPDLLPHAASSAAATRPRCPTARIETGHEHKRSRVDQLIRPPEGSGGI